MKKSSSRQEENPAIIMLANQYEKKIYDLQQLLEISRSLCSTIEFSQLIESLLYICMCQMRVLGVGLFVIDAIDSEELRLGSNYSGLDLADSVSYKLPISHPVVTELQSHNTVYTLPELKKLMPEDADLSPISSLNPSLIVPLLQRNHLNGILLLGERIDIGEGVTYTDYEKQQIQSIASLASIAINNATLVEQASTDMMTHLKLKHYFFNSLSEKLDMAAEQKIPLSVLMFDIDFFKKFNNTYGHECGDYVLTEVAHLIKTGIRDLDLASRYGGEEFTVMLPSTTGKDAKKVAERIRSSIEKTDFIYNNQLMRVTVSIGVAQYNPESAKLPTPKQLVDQADQALYVSKRNGRNMVTYATKKVLKEAAEYAANRM